MCLDIRHTNTARMNIRHHKMMLTGQSGLSGISLVLRLNTAKEKIKIAIYILITAAFER